MPAPAPEIESAGDRSQFSQRSAVQHLDVIVALISVLALAVIADQLTGRRSLDQALLVGGVGALCGAFLAVRVFAVGTLDGWLWVGWALGGAVLCLFAHFLFRSTR